MHFEQDFLLLEGYFFINWLWFWPRWVSSCGERGLLSRCGAHAPPRVASALGVTGSGVRRFQKLLHWAPQLWLTGLAASRHVASPGQGWNQSRSHCKVNYWPVDHQGSSQFSSVQWLSCVQLFATPWIAARQASLPITNSRSPPKLMCIESVMPSSHLTLCRPLLLLPPIPPSIRVFSNESALHMRWPKYWSFSFSISPSDGHPGLMSFRMDWLDLLAVQGTLKSLLQHHSSKASILQHSGFFTVQLSHPYMTTGKTIALTRRTFAYHMIDQ